MNLSANEVWRPVTLNPMQVRIRTWVLGAWLMLFALVWWRQLAQGSNLVHIGWAIFYSVPLLAPLPGLLKGKRYTHSWATLCVLPYFVVGVTEAVANMASRRWSLALLGAALLWFFAMISYLRASKSEPVQAD